MNIDHSTFSGNVAGDSGGAVGNLGGTVTITGSSFRQQSLTQAGGALNNVKEAR